METRSKAKQRRQIINDLIELPFNSAIIDENPELESKTMKITDLNNYCLERVFDYLNLQDLLNVAVSNTTLQYPATLLFKEKYSKKQMNIFDNKINYYKDGWKDGDVCSEINLREIQNFMLVFGDLIRSICFMDVQGFEEIFDTIFAHSPKSLLDIDFDGPPEEWRNKFHELKFWDSIRSFIEKLNVEELQFNICGLIPIMNERIHFQKIKRFLFHSIGFPFSFDHLERVSLWLIDIGQVDEIIQENKNLVKVELWAVDSTIVQSNELGKMSKLSLGLNLSLNYDDVDAIIEFVNRKSIASEIKITSVLEQNQDYNYFQQMKNGIDKIKWNLDIVHETDDEIILDLFPKV